MAKLSLAITLFQFSLAILLLVIGVVLSEIDGNGVVPYVCGGIWVAFLVLIIFMAGPREKLANDTSLGIFHILPVAMLVAAIPSMIGNLDHLNYMMGFVDFIVLMAMLVYGLICVRNLRWPPSGYWIYLVFGLLVLNRIR